MKKIIIGIGAALAVMIAAFIIFMATFDANSAKALVNRKVSAAIERPFEIRGDLTLRWVRQVGPLHYWLPRPNISANDIVIANTEWAKNDFGHIQRIEFILDPLPLLRKTVVLPQLDVDGANLALQRRADESNNWTFGAPNQPAQKSPWRFVPGLLRIHRSTVQLDDAKRQLAIKVEADSNDKGVGWSLAGKLNGAPLQAHGAAGSVLALQDKKNPYPIEAHIALGDTRIDAVGTLTDPTDLAALDLRLKLSGPSMAQLYPLTKVTLPETPPFATAGHLTGTLNAYGGKWHYENFSGKVGASDLQGSVVYEARATRPLLTGKLVSNLLNFADLAPLIGADSNENKERRNAAVLQPEDKVLPVEPFKTERWTSMDADVKFVGRKIVREKELPINDLKTTVTLQDGVLTLSPLNFGVAGGEMISTAVLDGRKQPLHATLDLAMRHLQLKELFPTIEAMQSSQGQINGSAALTGTGNSIAALLGGSDGNVRLFIDRGTVSKFILEAAGLNIANVVLTKLFGDRQVALNCAAAKFEADGGDLKTQSFIVDTEEAVIHVTGSVDLGDEKLDLKVKPETKAVRVLSLRAPLYVQGTLKHPDVKVDKGVLALRGGGAAALGALAGPAALLPLIDTGATELEKDNGCAQLLSQLGGSAQEPAPSIQVK